MAAPATAQDAPATPEATASAPAPQRENWSSRCVTPARQAPLECSIEQRLIMQNTSQLIASVTVRIPGASSQPLMVVQTPLGLFLPGGVAIDIDGASPSTLELQTCEANGCYASAPVSDALLASLARGQKLNIKFQNLNKQTITVSANLVGFTAAFQRIR